MRQFSIAIFLCFAFCALVNAGQRKIAYEREEKIFVADVDGTHSKKIAEGALPEISPDGARVAFNTEGDAKNRPGPERHITIADIAGGKVMQKENERQPSIYRMTLDGKNPKLLVKYARTPTATAP
jgi:TolB protein